MNQKILVDPVAPVDFDFRILHDEIDGFEVKDVYELGCRLKDISIWKVVPDIRNHPVRFSGKEFVTAKEYFQSCQGLKPPGIRCRLEI